MSRKSGRILYLDILKCIAIFMVCCIHYVMLKPNYIDNFFDMLNFAGVSLFFMCNGALLMHGRFELKKHYKKMAVIVVQLLCWSVISFICFYANYNSIWQHSIQDLSVTEAINYLISGSIWTMPTGHFWFIRALIAIYIIVPAFRLIPRDVGKKYIKFLITVIFFLVFIPNDLAIIQHALIKYFDSSIIPIQFSKLAEYQPINGYFNTIALVHFLVGGLLHETFYLNRECHINKLLLVLGILFGWSYSYFLKGISTGFDGSNFTALGNGYACPSVLLMSACFYILVCEIARDVDSVKMPAQKFVSLVADNTLGVFYLHCIFLGVISLRIYPLIPYRGTVVNLVKGFLIMLVSAAVAWIIKKIPIVKHLLT